MGGQDRLDLPRIDVLPAADDHVLDAAGDAEVAVLVENAEVTGVQPPVGVDRLPGLLRHLEVPEHRLVAARADLALRADRDGAPVGRVDDLELEVPPRAAVRVAALFVGTV